MKKFRSFKHAESTVQKHEKKSKAGMYFSIFIAGIMILSVGAIFLSNPNEPDYTYGKYDFKSKNNVWVSKINDKDVVFYFLPEQVMLKSFSNLAINMLKQSQGFIITFDPNLNSSEKLQAIDVLRLEVAESIFNSKSNKAVGFGVTSSSDKYALSVIDCMNSTFNAPVLVVGYGNETKIETDGKCIIATAQDQYSMMQINDYLKYLFYGVIKNE